MRFDRFECDSAVGVILAHTVRIPGKTLKKGSVLTQSDLALLQSYGITEVMGARLEAADVDEDQVALELAQALAGPALEIARPVAGRCNLYARSNGLVMINREVIDAINHCDAGIVIATLAERAECIAQQALASIKVIPFGVARTPLDACLELARASAPAIDLAAYRPHTAALILTRAAGMKESVLDATYRVTVERVTALGGQLLSQTRCEHSTAAVSAAITSALEPVPDLLLICGASITVDAADIIPSAISACSGTIDHFGMPVEPGNMLLLGHIGSTRVINMPGCSRSLKLNGLDWVLQRLAAGVPVDKGEILSMGVGGLIKDVSHRFRMRERSMVHEQLQLPHKVAAIVLAAGRSSRMDGPHKLLAPVAGTPMISRVVDAALNAQVCSTTVVTGYQAEAVRAELEGREVRFVHNADFADGIASSLKLGLSSVPEDTDGVIILLADMPFIAATHIDGLIAEFNPATERDIVAPTRRGRVGNPVLWSARYIPAMAKLEGDRGARSLLKEFAANVWEVPMGDDAIFMDVDTVAALAQANSHALDDDRRD